MVLFIRNKRVSCNLCSSNNYRVIYRKGGVKVKIPIKDEYRISEADIQKPEKIFKCNTCGLIFALQDRNFKYYADRYTDMVDREYVEEQRGRREASMNILKRIERYKKNGNLLDIGCANGFFLDEARRRNWKVYGVEMSKWAVRYAKEELNLDVVRGSLRKGAFPDKFFDVIVMLDVLEHLTDPKHTLLEVRRILKDGGILYINTPNISSIMSKVLGAKWWGINKFHLFYFSKNTFEKMLDACGFKVKKYSSHIMIFSLSYSAKRVKVYSPLLYKILDFISRLKNIGSIQLKVNLYDQIEAMAVKTR